ncbi:MAG: hypothetical protein NVSMB18_11120 [Acetobacteraceae bacterium]
MKKSALLLLPVLMLAAAAPAGAAIIDTSFSGVVTQQQNSTVTVGQIISGEFIYSTEQSAFRSFTIQGYKPLPGFLSKAAFTPGNYTALYQASVSAVQQGTTVNQALTLDLEGFNPFVASNAIALLSDTAQVFGNADPTFPSTFSYAFSNANGTNGVSFSANLTASANRVGLATSVPEPASLVLLAGSVLGLGAFRRRAA